MIKTLRPVLLAALLGAAVLALFIEVVSFDLIYIDDWNYIFEGGIVAQGLSWPAAGKAFSRLTGGALWVPVTTLSLMLDVSIFGMSPAGFHFTNALLHAANMALLALLLQRLTGAAGLSLATAALVAVHPLRVESVAWVAERKDVLAMFFALLAIAAYLRYVRSRRLVWYGGVLVSHALGLMAKPSLVPLPALLLVLDWWPLGRLGAGSASGLSGGYRLILEKLPLAALSAAIAVITLATHRWTILASYSGAGIAVGLERFLTTPLIYLRKTLYPVDLFLDPAFDPAPAFHKLHFLLATTVLAALSVGLWALRRRQPAAAAGWLWYLTALLPASRVTPSQYYSLGDRFTYLPHIGLGLLAVWSGARLLRRLPTRAIGVASLLAVLVLSTALLQYQLGFWRTSRDLLERGLAVRPGDAYLHLQLGEELLRLGKHEEAREQALIALGLDPGWGAPYYLLGAVLAKTGRTAEAIERLREALALPDIDGQIPITKFLLAELLWGSARGEEALPYYREAVAMAPNSLKYQLALASALNATGRPAEAVEVYRRSLSLVVSRREAAEAHLRLGRALQAAGGRAEGLRELEQAAFLAPDLIDTQFALGVALVDEGRVDEALARYRAARSLAPHDLPTLLNLAEVLFQAGRREDARGEFERIAGLFPASMEGLFAEGRLRALAGDNEGADRLYAAALSANPRLPETSDALRRYLRGP